MSAADKHCMPQASTVEIDEKLNILAPDLFQSNDILNNTIKAIKYFHSKNIIQVLPLLQDP